ncbi:hypothetical protein BP6252_06387 [Coleophoma cylindrospora]|uniref:MYND-type domain-containing protein n=1 Tax=Coleophoma cylindrospora TaxID=1849047 RepID=A0A3D8RMF7_9HELO|nr:hypothetical protein BP6252_06387 [Coleophoma cylindrospora]
MGRWGEGLFEGDHDLDEASYISEDAGIELYHYEIDEKDPESLGKGLAATRAHLNNGVLDRLFEQYSVKANTDDENSWGNEKLRLVILAALAMRVGATISSKYMDLLRTSYTQIHVSPKYSLPLADSNFRAPGKVQFETALRLYKNDGTPYSFDVARCAAVGCGKAHDDLDDGKKLLRCGKCKVASYCGKECQTAHWKEHKRVCKTPAQVEADLRRSSGPYVMLNV